MTEYKLVNGKITEDGHTMFMEDVVRRLERLDFLEKWKRNYHKYDKRIANMGKGDENE